MFGANATATPDRHLLQLRALDWNVDGLLCTMLVAPLLEMQFITMQDHSKTTLKSPCTIQTLITDMPLLISAGLAGLAP